MNKCTLAAKHKWQFVKNVTLREQTRATVTLSKRGSYKCECGERKIGAYRMVVLPERRIPAHEIINREQNLQDVEFNLALDEVAALNATTITAAELEGLRKDRRRLKWMCSRQAQMANNFEGDMSWVKIQHPDEEIGGMINACGNVTFSRWNDAIDAAMAGQATAGGE